MQHNALDLDITQELQNAAKKLAQNAEIMYGALEEADLPDRVVEEAFLIWWRITLTPGIEFPDITKMFPQPSDDE